MLEARDAIIVVGKRRWNVVLSRAFEFAPAKPLSKELQPFQPQTLVVCLLIWRCSTLCISFLKVLYCLVGFLLYRYRLVLIARPYSRSATTPGKFG